MKVVLTKNELQSEIEKIKGKKEKYRFGSNDGSFT